MDGHKGRTLQRDTNLRNLNNIYNVKCITPNWQAIRRLSPASDKRKRYDRHSKPQLQIPGSIP